LRHLCIGITKQLAKLLILLFAFHITGCSRTEQPETALADLPKQVAGASDANIVHLQARLNKAGVNILTLGQDYLLVIPSSLLFATQSPKLTWESYQLLNEVVCYLQQFRKITIHVNAFSSKFVSERREHALTLARAKTVAEYLWSQGIDSRFIFTQGSGSDKPIVVSNGGGDLSPNARIEISFRRAIE
jgi:intracellular multiplication protein IcmN